MRIGITGATGQLGRELRNILENHGHTVFPFSRVTLDIGDSDSFELKLTHLELDYLINAAAFTDVDLAEINIEKAFLVNADAPLHLAKFCKAKKIGLIHISTDSVFSSEIPQFFSATSSTNPINVYSKSKDAGEKAILAEYPEKSWIVRTAWIYGNYGGKFVHSIMSRTQDKAPFYVVDDQFGQPISTVVLSQYICKMINQNSVPGVYHLASKDFVSRFDFSRAIFRLLDADIERIMPISTTTSKGLALRPKYSLIGTDDTEEQLSISMKSWDYYLEGFVRNLRGKE